MVGTKAAGKATNLLEWKWRANSKGWVECEKEGGEGVAVMALPCFADQIAREYLISVSPSSTAHQPHFPINPVSAHTSDFALSSGSQCAGFLSC